MKRINKLITACLAILLIATGCSLSKTALTQKEFQEKLEGKNFTVTDVTTQFEKIDQIETATIAIDEDKTYKIEFYELKSEDDASSMFESNKNKFEESTSNNAQVTVNMVNYNTFAISNKTVYRYLSRVGKTLIYVDTDKENKEKIEEIMDELRY